MLALPKVLCRPIVALCLIATAASAAGEDKIPWILDLETARQQAIATNRLILVHFTGEKCVPCKRLEKNVYSRPQFGFTMIQQYAPVKINASQSPDLARQFKVTSWPTDIIIAPSGHEIHRMTPPADPQNYLNMLGQVSWRYRQMMAGSGTMAQFTPNALQAQVQANRTPQASRRPNGKNNAFGGSPVSTGSPYSYQQAQYNPEGIPRTGRVPNFQNSNAANAVDARMVAGQQSQQAGNRIPTAGNPNGAYAQLAGGVNALASQYGATPVQQLGFGASPAENQTPAATPSSNGPLPSVGYTQSIPTPPPALPAAATNSGPHSARVPESLVIKNEFFEKKVAAAEKATTAATSVVNKVVNASKEAVAAVTEKATNLVQPLAPAEAPVVLTPPQASSTLQAPRQAISPQRAIAPQQTIAPQQAIAPQLAKVQAQVVGPETMVETVTHLIGEPATANAGTPEPANPAVAQVAAQQPEIKSPKSDSSDLSMDGYCCVTLHNENRWAKGDTRWGARHRGRVYLFNSAASQQQFLADPDKYSPILAGYDPVSFRDSSQLSTGSRNHGVRYDEHMFLFESEASLQKFWSSPEQYAAAAYKAMQEQAQ